jgi:glycerol transport system ATP-binding protein
MSVYDNLAFPLRNRKMPEPQVGARVREVAQMLDLERHLKRRARRLTADMKQKISLGRGLVRADVGAILFDEPLTVIDPHMKWQLRAQLKRVQEQSNATMIYVTHDQTEALTFARQVVVMYEGEVVQTGTPRELFERPAHTFVGYFIGSPGMNVIPASVENGHAIIKGHRIALERSYGALPQGVAIEAGIRPEFIAIGPSGSGIPVQVKRIEDTGRFKIARVELDGHPLSVVAPEDAVIDGSQASITLNPKHLHLYAGGHLVEGGA